MRRAEGWRQDFVALCLENFKTLPIGLVMSVSYAADQVWQPALCVCWSCGRQVHRVLSHNITARLTVKQFETPEAALQIESVAPVLWSHQLGGAVLSGQVLSRLLERCVAQC